MLENKVNNELQVFYFENVMEPIEFALNSEKEVTKGISYIYDLALQRKDYLTTQFLSWFLEEQVEEETW